MDEKQLLYVLIGIAALNLILSLMSKAEDFAAPTKAVTATPAPARAAKK